MTKIKRMLAVVVMLAVLVAGFAPAAFAQQGAAAEETEPEPAAETEPEAEPGDDAEPRIGAEAEDQVEPGDDDPSIVGGTKVENKYPFIAALLDESRGNAPHTQQFCGGSLIDPQHVLTAAHCVDDLSFKQRTNLRVAVGSTQLTTHNREVRKVINISTHKNYNSKTLENDVSVIRLDSPVTGIKPAILNGRGTSSYEKPGQLVRIAGWGQRVSGGKEDLDHLLEARVPIVSDAEADKQYNRDEYVPSTMIAAGGKGKDTCQGDSGGPLFVYNGSAYVLVGITSGGIECGQGGIPAAYTEVSAPAIYDYIQSQ
jgi:secreted trypsin-like serine protease